MTTKQFFNFLLSPWRNRQPVKSMSSLPIHCPQIDLALIHSTSNGRYAVDVNGDVYPWPDTLKESSRYLGEKEYARVNKSFLVAYSAIADFKRDTSKKSCSASRQYRVFRIILSFKFNTPVYTTYENSARIRRIWHWQKK